MDNEICLQTHCKYRRYYVVTKHMIVNALSYLCFNPLVLCKTNFHLIPFSYRKNEI